jgi:ABC-type sugar transport system ATPase subunit
VPAVTGISFALMPGALWAVEVPDENTGAWLADAASGLDPATAGSVRFEGRPWASFDVDEHTAALALYVGRVFRSHAWVSNLDVDENLLLAQRHHTRRSEPELIAAAQTAARRFGLEGVPEGRPAWARARDLQLAQWARAWLSAPRLLVLEEPLYACAKADAGPLFAAIDASLASGAAALWIARDLRAVCARYPLAPVCEIQDSRWIGPKTSDPGTAITEPRPRPEGNGDPS